MLKSSSTLPSARYSTNQVYGQTVDEMGRRDQFGQSPIVPKISGGEDAALVALLTISAIRIPPLRVRDFRGDTRSIPSCLLPRVTHSPDGPRAIIADKQ